MRRSYLKYPIRAYPRLPILIFIALGCLGYGNSLIRNYKAIILYQGAVFSIRRSILLYYLLMILVLGIKANGHYIRQVALT